MSCISTEESQRFIWQSDKMFCCIFMFIKGIFCPIILITNWASITQPFHVSFNMHSYVGVSSCCVSTSQASPIANSNFEKKLHLLYFNFFSSHWSSIKLSNLIVWWCYSVVISWFVFIIHLCQTFITPRENPRLRPVGPPSGGSKEIGQNLDNGSENSENQ